MILVDTSVWIALLNGKRGRKIRADSILQFVTCGPVAQEVVQGLRASEWTRSFRETFNEIPRLGDPLSFDIFLQAAEIYSSGRSKGYTIRSSIDCLIAAIAIQNDVPVWHQDRDFTTIAKFTRLRVYDRAGLTLL